MSCLEDTYTFSFSEKLYNIKTYGSNLKPYTEVDIKFKPAGYEIHPLLLDLLHSKTFVGNQTFEDPYFHLDYFENLCSICTLPKFQPEEVKLKLFGATDRKSVV